MTLSKKPYKGCRDFFPSQMREREYLFEKMKLAAQRFSYEPFDGPMLEEVELYKAKSGEELINEQIYDFVDRGKRHVAIRPELTPTVARMVAQVHRQTPKPIRWYSIPNLMRYERPQKGRLREHWQFNVDVFGAPEGLGELETLCLLAHLLESFGATKEMFSIQINDRKIVDFVFEKLLKATQEESYRLYKIIDKSKKIDRQALTKLVDEVIQDKGNRSIFFSYLELTNFSQLESFLSKHDYKDLESFKAFTSLLHESDAGKYIHYDPAIVRGLDYYTGMVFEVFDLHPDNRRALAGGGAYANLLQIFNEPALGGVGFGMGDVTLSDFLRAHNLLPDFSHQSNDLFIAYLDDAGASLALKAAQELRRAGLRVESHLGSLKFQKVFKSAQDKGHDNVAIIGEEEVKTRSLTIKGLKRHEQRTFKLEQISEIKTFLKQG